jgi:hypothetical protein
MHTKESITAAVTSHVSCPEKIVCACMAIPASGTPQYKYCAQKKTSKPKNDQELQGNGDTETMPELDHAQCTVSALIGPYALPLLISSRYLLSFIL